MIKSIFSPSIYLPVVVSEESQYLVGFVARKDLAASVENANRHIVDSDPDEASVFFTEVVPAIPSPSDGMLQLVMPHACLVKQGCLLSAEI